MDKLKFNLTEENIMNTLAALTTSEEGLALKRQYKAGLVCAYEVAIALVNTCSFDNTDTTCFDTLFESLQAWVKE